MRKYRRKMLEMVFLVAVVAGSGCGHSGQPRIETTILPYTSEQQEAREGARSARYRLRDGDVLKISFKYEQDLDQAAVLVLPDGFISPEGIGRAVRAAGLTVDELDTVLTTEYARDYRDPDLSVVIMEITQPDVYVLGMVKAPGMYKMSVNGTSVLGAIASAGGFLADAQKSEVVIMRATNDGFLLRSLDLAHLEHLGIQDLTMFDLQPYDVIYVPRSSLGDFKYLSEAIFGSSLDITRFFWDIYSIANINQVDTIIR